MEQISEFLCVGLKRSLASPLPWDIPLYDPSHIIFFGALYAALGVIGIGLVASVIIALKRIRSGEEGGHH